MTQVARFSRGTLGGVGLQAEIWFYAFKHRRGHSHWHRTARCHLPGSDRYRAQMHSALTIEEVLVKHPKLRVYIMHASLSDD